MYEMVLWALTAHNMCATGAQMTTRCVKIFSIITEKCYNFL